MEASVVGLIGSKPLEFARTSPMPCSARPQLLGLCCRRRTVRCSPQLPLRTVGVLGDDAAPATWFGLLQLLLLAWRFPGQGSRTPRSCCSSRANLPTQLPSRCQTRLLARQLPRLRSLLEPLAEAGPECAGLR